MATGLGLFDKSKTTENANIGFMEFVKQLHETTQKFLEAIDQRWRFVCHPTLHKYELRYISNGYSYKDKPDQEVDKLIIYLPPKILQDFLTKNCSSQIEVKEMIDGAKGFTLEIKKKSPANLQSPISCAQLLSQYEQITESKIQLIKNFCAIYDQMFLQIDKNIRDMVKLQSSGEGENGKIQIDFTIIRAKFEDSQLSKVGEELLNLAKAHKLDAKGFIQSVNPSVRIQIGENDLNNLKAYIHDMQGVMVPLIQTPNSCSIS